MSRPWPGAVLALLTGCLLPRLAALQAQPIGSAQEVCLDLEQALRMAEVNSAQLRRLRAQPAVAKERLRIATRSFFPHVELGYGHNDSVLYGAPDSRSRSLSVDVQMLVFAGGARSGERERQRSALALAEATVLASHAELQVEVARRFIQVLTLRLQRQLIEDSRRSTERQVAIALEERRLGEITEWDYLAMAVAAKDLQLQSARTEAEEQGLLFELRQIVGLPPDWRLKISGSIDPEYPGLLESLDPETCLAAAQEASLELRSRRAELSALERTARCARLAWIPHLTAEAQVSASGDQFPLSEPGFSLGLSLDFSAPLLPASIEAGAGRYGNHQRTSSAAASLGVGENLESVHAARLARLELETASAMFADFQAALRFSILQQLDERTRQLQALQLLREKAMLQADRQGVLAMMVDLGEVTRTSFVEGELELARLRLETLAAVSALFELEVGLLASCGLPVPLHGLRRIILPEVRP